MPIASRQQTSVENVSSFCAYLVNQHHTLMWRRSERRAMTKRQRLTASRRGKKQNRGKSGEAVNYRAVACVLAAGEKVEAQRVWEGPPVVPRALSAPPGGPRTGRALHANARGAHSLLFDGHMVPRPSFPQLAPLGGPDNPNPIPTAVCTQWHRLPPPSEKYSTLRLISSQCTDTDINYSAML